MKNANIHTVIVTTLFCGTVLALVYFAGPAFFITTYDARSEAVPQEDVSLQEEAPKFVVRHITTPHPLKAVYMTSWIAGTPKLREKIVKLIHETELNAIVIDIKDDTGRISFPVTDPYLQKIGSSDPRIKDLEEFLDELHSKNIYVIGRVAVFQDPYLVRARPDLAVRRKSDGGIWKDRKGLTWLDAGATEVWDYVVAIGKEAYSHGFDEINYDYIRFPSDGDIADIAYTVSAGQKKSDVIKEFSAYLSLMTKPEIPVISADLFGMTTSSQSDMNIGQLLENALPYFDYIAPMVYPSHYPSGFNGYKNPATVPYEIVHYAMQSGVDRAELASTSPLKLRPWLQDFDLGADYTAEMVRAQIKATYDVGLDSWMMWNASNVYTQGAYNTVDEIQNE